MSCQLSKYDTYPLNSVQKDMSAKKFIVNLQRPPSTCPEGQFISGSAILRVESGVPVPLLGFSSQKNKPVITVSSMSQVQEINQPEGMGAGGFLLVVGTLALIGYALYRWFNRPFSSYAAGGKGSNGGGDGGSGYVRGSGSVAIGGRGGGPGGGPGGYASGGSRGGGGTTVVNNNGGVGGSDLLAGVLIGSAMSGGHGSTEVIHEREVIRERDSGGSFSSDDSPATSSDSGSFSSDDSGSSYSSDDSSDSGSSSSDSYSSDSSSSSDSFSSDSGSFGSDS